MSAGPGVKRPAGGGRLLRAGVVLSSWLLVAGLLAGCSGSTSKAQPAAKASASPATHYVGSLSLQPAGGPVGTVVTATGQGFPANQAVDFTWQEVTGSWKTDKGQFAGSNYSEKYVTVASGTTGADGSVTATFKVPAGFGQSHNVRVTHAGVNWNQAGFKIPLAASIEPKSGPPGTPISVTLTGIGFKTYYQSYILTYDNLETGWLSAVTTQGTARATIPATGGPGVHFLSFYAAGDRIPYLNNQQSPVSGPTYVLPFTVTNDAPRLPASVESQAPAPVDAVRPAAATAGPQIWLDRASGPPGTPLVLQGKGFTPGQTVEVGWTTLQGNNVGSGIGQVTKNLTTAITQDSEGAFSVRFPAPSDLYGAHNISATVGNQTATTSFAIAPKPLPLEKTSGPVGTPLLIHLVGTGSSFTSNIYTVVYDNHFVGFGCGFNTGGDIQMPMPATGAPGWHYIDLYPAVWKVPEVQIGAADYIQMPQLTYADDHPVEKLPAFHYAFYVTGEAS